MDRWDVLSPIAAAVRRRRCGRLAYRHGGEPLRGGGGSGRCPGHPGDRRGSGLASTVTESHDVPSDDIGVRELPPMRSNGCRLVNCAVRRTHRRRCFPRMPRQSSGTGRTSGERSCMSAVFERLPAVFRSRPRRIGFSGADVQPAPRELAHAPRLRPSRPDSGSRRTGRWIGGIKSGGAGDMERLERHLYEQLEVVALRSRQRTVAGAQEERAGSPGFPLN